MAIKRWGSFAAAISRVYKPPNENIIALRHLAYAKAKHTGYGVRVSFCAVSTFMESPLVVWEPTVSRNMGNLFTNSLYFLCENPQSESLPFCE